MSASDRKTAEVFGKGGPNSERQKEKEKSKKIKSMQTDIAFVIAVGRGKTLDKSFYLAKSIRYFYPDAEIYAFVAEEERAEIPREKLFAIETYSTLIYGYIPMKEYIFTVKHQALILAGAQTNAKYLACLDSDMLLLNQFNLDDGYDMFVCPVDVGNTSWGRESSAPLWKELYNHVGSPFPDYRLRALKDNYLMHPYFNGGFVITTDHSFGSKWLNLTKEVFEKIPEYDKYVDEYGGKSKRSRFLLKKIPYSHWTEQVTLTLLASKYNTKILDYSYDYPLNIMWSCPSETRLIHYHDQRNFVKLRRPEHKCLLKDIGITRNNNILNSYMRIIIYSYLRWMKIKLGKF